MAAAEAPQPLQLRLTVDTKQMRLVYAECDRFMADVLFSFLTTPVAALVRRTGISSGLPFMDSLYRCVQRMDLPYFQTAQCRDLLLLPRSAFGFPLHRLKLHVNDVEEGYYVCPTRKCPKCSLFAGVKCVCGQALTDPISFKFPPPKGGDAVFIAANTATDFLVTDDLFIAPSTPALRSRIQSLVGVATPGSLIQHIVPVDDDKIVQLMKLSLLSNNPLTDAFLPKTFVAEPLHWPLGFWKPRPLYEEECTMWFYKWLYKCLLRLLTKKMKITLFHDQDRVLYAIVDERFVDLLLSFLVLPFGSVIAAFDGRSSLKCLDHVHNSVQRFRADILFAQYMHDPFDYADVILNPPIALHHSSQNQLLKIGQRPFTLYSINCKHCDITGDPSCSKKGHTHHSMKPINPKHFGNERTKEGGGYMRPQGNYVITSDFVVKPNYDLTDIIRATGLVAKTVRVGRKEALKLLMASLVSKDPLTNAFMRVDVKYEKKNDV